jgi:hypothetical protein
MVAPHVANGLLERAAALVLAVDHLLARVDDPLNFFTCRAHTVAHRSLRVDELQQNDPSVSARQADGLERSPSLAATAGAAGSAVRTVPSSTTSN